MCTWSLDSLSAAKSALFSVTMIYSVNSSTKFYVSNLSDIVAMLGQAGVRLKGGDKNAIDDLTILIVVVNLTVGESSWYL